MLREASLRTYIQLSHPRWFCNVVIKGLILYVSKAYKEWVTLQNIIYVTRPRKVSAEFTTALRITDLNDDVLLQKEANI